MSEFTLPGSKIVSGLKSADKYASDTASLVIFDGARYFLKFRDYLKGPVKVVFLDRTESHFANAADELMQRYYDRRSGITLFNQTELPVEVLAFEEQHE